MRVLRSRFIDFLEPIFGAKIFWAIQQFIFDSQKQLFALLHQIKRLILVGGGLLISHLHYLLMTQTDLLPYGKDSEAEKVTKLHQSAPK